MPCYDGKSWWVTTWFKNSGFILGGNTATQVRSREILEIGQFTKFMILNEDLQIEKIVSTTDWQ